MTLPVGARLGPYEILALVGAGGMGEVYRARDERLAREVAVKLLPQDLSADADRVRRFEQETRLAGSLNHPNIVTVHDVGRHHGSSYLVTELLDGETLRQRLPEQPLPPRKALDWAVQVARGLAAAHAKGIVHRDLKPENLFVTRDGRVKILDFGLAKLARTEGHDLESAVSGTSPGVVLGTVGYMSPEQVRCQAADHRADIFSFGAILFEMLSGRRAFEGDSSIETLNAILLAEVPDLAQLDPSVPPALGNIVRHCLEKDPAERFQSARDVAFDLENVSIVSAPAAGPAPRGAARTRRVWPWVLAAIALVAAVFAGFTMGRRAAPPAAPPSPVRVQRLTDMAGLEESPAVSPDGKSVAFSAAVGGRRQIFVRLMAGGAPLQVTRDTADHDFPRWTPDSSSLLYFSPGGEQSIGTVWEVSALGGVPRRIASSMSGADVSHDGRRIAFFRFNEGRVELMVAARDGSSEKVITRLEPLSSRGIGSAQFQYPRWSPDDRLLAYQSGLNWFAHNVFIVPVEGAPPRPILEGATVIQGFTWRPDGTGIVYSSSSGTTILYLPTFNLWDVPLDGGSPRQLTFGEVSYLTPDVRTSGLLVASRVRAQFDVWKFPVKGNPAEAVAKAVNLTRQTGQVQTPSVSPGDRELVYLADSGGHGNLWVLDLESGETRQITFEQDARVAVGVPVWSPDGKRIAFVSTRGNPPGIVGVWLVRPDGTDLRQIVPSGGWACWSSDGEWLQYNVLPETVLKRMPAAGGPAVTVRSEASRSSLSPDGRTLYYVLELPDLTGRPDYELRAASPPEGPSRLLAKIPAARVASWQLFHPVISPDGLWLALPLTDGVTTNIWALSTRDGSLRPLTDFGQRPTFIARRVSWSSDGGSIYAALGEGDADVVMLEGLR